MKKLNLFIISSFLISCSGFEESTSLKESTSFSSSHCSPITSLPKLAGAFFHYNTSLKVHGDEITIKMNFFKDKKCDSSIARVTFEGDSLEKKILEMDDIFPNFREAVTDYEKALELKLRVRSLELFLKDDLLLPLLRDVITQYLHLNCKVTYDDLRGDIISLNGMVCEKLKLPKVDTVLYYYIALKKQNFTTLKQDCTLEKTLKEVPALFLGHYTCISEGVPLNSPSSSSKGCIHLLGEMSK